MKGIGDGELSREVTPPGVLSSTCFSMELGWGVGGLGMLAQSLESRIVIRHPWGTDPV